MKKNEKLRNVKAVKNQIQQIEVYIEKLQVRKLSFNLILLMFSSESSLSSDLIIQTYTSLSSFNALTVFYL